MSRRGLFVTFEGIDGCGKSTQFTEQLIHAYQMLVKLAAYDSRVRRVTGPVVLIDGAQEMETVEAEIAKAFQTVYA